MGTWSITQTDATIDGNGLAHFPKNRSNGAKVYNINYQSDEGCETSTTYTVPNCPCNCDDVQFIENPTYFGPDGGEHIVGTVDADCASSFGTIGTSTWFTISLNEHHNIVVSAEANTGTSARGAGISYKMGDNPCGEGIRVIQEANEQIYDIHIFGKITSYRPQGANYDVYKIEIDYTRQDGGTSTASAFPLNISNEKASYEYVKCNGEYAIPENVTLPVEHRICQGTVGDAQTAPSLNSLSCHVAMADTQADLVVHSGMPPAELTVDIQSTQYNNLKYKIVFTLYE